MQLNFVSSFCKSVLSLMLCTIALPGFAILDEQHSFSNIDEFLKYGAEEIQKKFGEICEPTSSRLVTEYLYSDKTDLSIITIKNSCVSDELGVDWPVLLLWSSNNGIITQRIETAPSLVKGMEEELKIMGIKKVFVGSEGIEAYAIYVYKSRTERLSRLDEPEKFVDVCSIVNDVHIAVLDRRNKSINMLTEVPIPLGVSNICKSKLKDSLSFESKNNTLVLVENNALAPEQRSWTGKYTILSGKLLRVDEESVIRKRLMEADIQAVEYFRKRELKTSISLLAPLIDYSPDVMDSQTVKAYNDYAFFLSEVADRKKALPILETIVRKFPNRAVAHLNIADIYWSRDKERARSHYQKYVELMASENKNALIPEKVWKRLKK